LTFVKMIQKVKVFVTGAATACIISHQAQEIGNLFWCC